MDSDWPMEKFSVGEMLLPSLVWYAAVLSKLILKAAITWCQTFRGHKLQPYQVLMENDSEIINSYWGQNTDDIF